MKKPVFGFVLAFLVIAMAIMACGVTTQNATPVYIVVTATPIPTATPAPTFTPIPTPTPTPTQPLGFGTHDEMKADWDGMGFVFHNAMIANPESGEPMIMGENGTTTILLSGYPHITDVGISALVNDQNGSINGEYFAYLMDSTVPSCDHCIGWVSDALTEFSESPDRERDVAMYYENVRISLNCIWAPGMDGVVVSLRIVDE